MKQKIFKTVLRIEVLTPEPINDCTPIDVLLRECDEGEYSGHYITEQLNVALRGKRAVNEVLKHGSDPSFFMMDDKGNDIDY